MINQMLDALQNKSAIVSRDSNNNVVVVFRTLVGNLFRATLLQNENKVSFLNLEIIEFSNQQYKLYINQADLMAMIYYINEYGVEK